MKLLPLLKQELTEEYKITKKFFSRFPEDKTAYAPHEKSMKLMPLCTHIADVFEWPAIILNTPGLDFAETPTPEKIETIQQLNTRLEKAFAASVSALENAMEEDLEPNWHISMRGQKLQEWTKYGAIRHSLNQITHHRAQLGVYYRLSEIPLPSSYGPSADDQRF